MNNTKETVSLLLFKTLTVTISAEDWDFMCKNRFGTDDPPYEEIQAEFVSGTGITEKKRELWNEADKRFSDYISDLKDISTMDLNKAARELLNIERERLCI